MANTVLLILTNSSKVGKLLPVIQRHVSKTLYIQYFPDKHLPSGSYSSLLQWKLLPNHYQKIANIYALATTFLSKIDVRVLISSTKKSSLISTVRPIELVIFDRNYSKEDAKMFIKNCIKNSAEPCNFIAINDPQDADECSAEILDDDVSNNENKIYNNTVLGGTFDRLHNGHKILLSKAILKCSNKLTVGVTDSSMISRKILWELIEPCEKRMNALREFLNDVNPNLIYDIVPINDIYGPTKDDPSFEMIVVSEETQRGAAKINELRLQKGLNQLDVEVVKLVEDSHHSNNNEEIAEKLNSLGAEIVHCDKLAHDLYNPGQQCFNQVVENFGQQILTSSGQIDRKALANIVFSNKEELDKLNRIMWPAILDVAMSKIKELQAQGAKIIVMEAAVLIQAKWQYVCHEIWTCIIPHEEAVKRVMERNNLSKEEAEMRIKVQPSNVEQVNEATVVLSTLWSHDVTLSQVQKAWELLNQFLSKQ
ncbi:Similar to COASY: Bifunctional coenzyme A synthase (Sus scrofa) [Cotesia congregata]|uniref:Similar to COASY: Bifunctional coenzyme A synthase (Sus scrofa) n=1 Tax=Cotesia congregata TaxID=51543 RepID=A0A8J2MIT2_COTCN|nr:Similar to COASY: Bifunctional coenzyme A synthase (Sus scrofa) [Cotesia congregata]